MKTSLQKLMAFLTMLSFAFCTFSSVSNYDSSIKANAAEPVEISYSFLSSIPEGWTSSRTPDGYESTGNSRGAQYLNKNFSSLTLSYSSTLTYDLVSITVATNGTASKTQISVNVGGVALGTSQTLTATAATKYTFSGDPLQGNIVITISTTNTDKSTYIKATTLREGAAATGTISINNSSERLMLGNSLVITPSLGGIGTLSASINDGTIASLSTSATTVTITPIKIGLAEITISYGGSNVALQLEVYVPSISLSSSSLKLLPEQVTNITATPQDFTPTSYLWTKEDPSGVISLSNTTSATVTITASEILGTATVTVEASDGTISKTASLTVSVADIAQGMYTISSATTTFTSNPTINLLTVSKSDADLGAIALSTFSNFRLGANASGDSSVNTKMLFGSSETTPGSATFTLPEGLVATSVKLTGITRSTDSTTPQPTIKINDVLKYTHSTNGSEFSTKVYSNSITIASTTKRLWVGTIEIVAEAHIDATLDFGSYFIETTSTECSNLNVSSDTWTNLKTIFDGMDSTLKSIIRSTSANNDGSDLEKAIGRYNFIINKYSYNDFLEASGGPLDSNPIIKENNPTNDLTINTLIIIGLIGFTTLASYLYLKKKHTI